MTDNPFKPPRAPLLDAQPPFPARMPNRNILAREPVVLAFCIVSVAVWIGAVAGLPLPEWLGLRPARVIENFELWRLVLHTIVHSPYDVFHLLAVLVPSLYFGWHLEPCVSSRQVLALILACSLASGVASTFAVNQQALFFGGASVASGLGAALFASSALDRKSASLSIRVFWALAIVYALLKIAPPVSISPTELLSWLIGGLWAYVARRRALASRT